MAGMEGSARISVVLGVLIPISFCLGVGWGLISAAREVFPYSLARRAFYAVAVPPKEYGGDTPGMWRPRRPVKGQEELTEEQREEMAKLAALGYLRGSKPAGEREGVTLHDPERAYQGLNLFTSGHGPEALLMDMEGEVLHSWKRDLWSVWPDWEEARGVTGAEHWACAHLFENGDLLAIFAGFGMIKIDKDSNLIWSYDGGSHHDLFVADDGSIYTLDREPRMIPRIHETEPVMEDFITVLGPDGALLRRFSVLEAFERSQYAPVLSRMPPSRDILHSNSIEVLDGSLAHRSGAFRKGNVLISVRQLDTIAVVDMETEAVVWALTGRWKEQHDPTVLPNGRILLFNNFASDDASEVLEFDPFTQEVFWSYEGGGGIDFFTAEVGANQRLPNGNTVIVESVNGRVFEVTPDKAIVWEFINPNRAGERNELIATLRGMDRLPPDFPLDWLRKGGS
jgi:hypothetical protein